MIVLGVISGRQLYKSGPINYSKTLPKECRLSENCKELVEHILANVFALKWQFSEYFSTVQNLLSKVVIHTFVLHSAECDPIYMNSNDGLVLHINDDPLPSSASKTSTSLLRLIALNRTGCIILVIEHFSIKNDSLEYKFHF